MTQRLTVTLAPGWIASPDTAADDPPAFLRQASRAPGVLQIHTEAYYRRGPVPNPTPQQLIALAAHAAEAEGVIITARSTGPCRLGTYGTVIGSSPGFPHVQIWALSNGRDFFVLSHACRSAPEAEELADAQTIVGMLAMPALKKPWWRLW